MIGLPLATVERIMRTSGAERISNDAVKASAEKAEDLIRKLTAEAIVLSKHAGRKTVTEEDIELAYRR
ncbi:MAG: NFYB/HAP3 family transcription factor subunit [Candidatus Altiarchaeota archaeon]|nr:NFYB/HAP3 family transcription factor subunit [Candidatus Altiarchaeota archaeon]